MLASKIYPNLKGAHMNSVKLKVAKVIATSFVPRVIRPKTSITGTPPGFFAHSQSYTNSNQILELIDLQIKLHNQSVDMTPCDIIIVNNDVGDGNANSKLMSLNGKNLINGSIKVVHRKNYGRSFGAYNYAFETFGDKYSHYLFTEDDIIPHGKGHLEHGIRVLRTHDTFAFVAYQALSSKYVCDWIKDTTHAHGGVGMAPYKALSALYRVNGCLPHAASSESQQYANIIFEGEVKFTNAFIGLGFCLTTFPPHYKHYDFAYDYQRGKRIGRFCNPLQYKLICRHYFQILILIAYHLLVLNRLSLKVLHP